MHQKDLPTRQVFLFLSLEERRRFDGQRSQANLSIDQSPNSLDTFNRKLHFTTLTTSL